MISRNALVSGSGVRLFRKTGVDTLIELETARKEASKTRQESRASNGRVLGKQTSSFDLNGMEINYNGETRNTPSLVSISWSDCSCTSDLCDLTYTCSRDS